jgi:ribA/ribD-fused uncharacterized protein
MIEHLTDKINGQVVHHWPSNFYIEPDNTTVENEFQAEKTLDLREKAEILTICDAEGIITPGRAKSLGRKVNLRRDWESVKIDVMRGLVLRKALDHAEFVDWLLESGDELIVEGNWWHDNFWGRCFCKKCEHGRDARGLAEAKNHLGLILMEVRTVISTWDEGYQHGHC